MTSRDRLWVGVTGLAGGNGELTWGQRFVWDILQSLAPANHYISLRFRIHLPQNATRERLLRAVRTLLRRYDSLRTRFPVGEDGEPRQACDPAGELPVEVCETDLGRVRQLAEQEEERLWREPFDHEREWPLRVSLIVADGRPRQIVLVFSHLAVDAWGCWLFRRDLLELLRREDAEPSLPGWRPRDRAAYETSASGRKVNDRSLAYWRRMLATAPQTAFPAQPEARETPRFPGVSLYSVALAAAVRALAARHRVGPAAVVVALLSSILGIRTGTEVVPLVLATGNRFTSADTASVGTFYQIAPVLTRLDPGSLAGTIQNAAKASIVAYLRGQSDPRDVARLLAAARTARGVNHDLSSTLNVVPEPGTAGMLPTTEDATALRELMGATQVSDLEGRDQEQLKLYLHVKSLRSRAVIELYCDSRFLTAAAARKVLAGLEVVLIELIEARDLSLDRVADLVGITPLRRPPGCVLVDSCWVDVAAVGRLLDGLSGTVASRVFVLRSDDGLPRLVGYVVAAQPTTPERLHGAVVSRLDGHLTMAPQWYVVCRGAPARPESPAEWQRQAVLAQGSGRADQHLTELDSVPPIIAHRGS